MDHSTLLAKEDREPFKLRLIENGIRRLTQWMALSKDEKKIYPQMLVKTLDEATGKSSAL